MSKIKAKFILDPVYKNLLHETPQAVIGATFYQSRYDFIVVLVALGLLMAVVLNVSYRQAQNDLLLSEGQQTQGELINCTVVGRYGHEISIDYRYTVGGVVYNNNIRNVGNSCAGYSSGSVFPVIYRPTNPAESGFNGLTDDPLTQPLALIGGISSLILFIYTLHLIPRLYGEIKIDMLRLKEGQRRLPQGIVLDGEIVDVRGSAMVTVQYRFTTPHGNSLIGWTSAYRPDLKGKLPLVGTPILILYISDTDHQAL